jgi:hypothetical protein
VRGRIGVTATDRVLLYVTFCGVADGARTRTATTSPIGTKPTCLYVRYSVAMWWKADFEQAASVIVLCARQGASAALAQ